MSDRTAFLRHIADNPSDNLARLVFADWLEEHGEAARAEFIRLQIQGRSANRSQRKPLDQRAWQLFFAHGAEWFGPFLRALDPNLDPRLAYRYHGSGGTESCEIEGPRTTPSPYVRRAVIRNGFVDAVELELDAQPRRSSIGQARFTEPFTKLSVHCSLDGPAWDRFSEPGLRGVSQLTLFEVWGSSGVPTAVFRDANLTGVHKLERLCRGGPRIGYVSTGTLHDYCESPLGERVTDLRLDTDADGLRILSLAQSLPLERLRIFASHLTPSALRAFLRAPFVPSLRAFEIDSRVDAEVAQSLAESDRLHNLTELGLGWYSAGIGAFARAPFVRQLEVLTIGSLIPLDGSQIDSREVHGLLALADALDPNRFRELRLPGWKRANVPPRLLSQFGNRVKLA